MNASAGGRAFRAGNCLLLLLAAALVAGCVTAAPGPVVTTPRFPNYPMPDIPAALQAEATVVARHEAAWRRLQAGDLGGARSELVDVLARAPAFYPAETALGYVELASKRPAEAAERFAAAIARGGGYLPAWTGQVEALLALGRDADAIVAMERALTLDPRRDQLRARLELVRFRLVQSLIESGQQARAAGRLEQARQVFEQALARSPESALILRELTLVARETGDLDRAESLARHAVAIDPRDPDALVTLARVLEDRGKFVEAATMYERTFARDPRGEWRERSVELRTRAKMAALPPEFAAVPNAASVTRAQVAAYVGIRLEAIIGGAPARVVDVATDVRRHWAAPWILPVTRAGVMTVYPNHTFQPGAPVPRADLAAAVAELLHLALAGRPDDLTKWRASRPRFPDMSTANVSYRAAALAVTAGAMAANDRGEFEPTRPASGPELEMAVRRIETLDNR